MSNAYLNSNYYSEPDPRPEKHHGFPLGHHNAAQPADPAADPFADSNAASASSSGLHDQRVTVVEGHTPSHHYSAVKKVPIDSHPDGPKEVGELPYSELPEVGVMEKAKDVEKALRTERGSQPAYAFAVLRSYTQHKFDEGHKQGHVEGKLDHLEEKIPEFCQTFFQVRRYFGIPENS